MRIYFINKTKLLQRICDFYFQNFNKTFTNDVVNFKQQCPVLQAIHTLLFRQVTGACVETATENTGLSRNPAVIWPVPETSPSCVVAGGLMLYTESCVKVIFKYLSFSPIRQAFPFLWEPDIFLYRHAVSVLGHFSSRNLSVFACLSRRIYL